MNAIVTGGAGFVGSNLVDRLIDQGWRVAVFDNFATGNKQNINPKAVQYHIDIRSNLAAEGPGITPLDGHEDVPYVIGEIGFVPDVIFHLAALARIQPSYSRPYETLSVNCDGTARVLELARKINARVVYAGSSSFYADPLKNPYAYSKWVGEEHCKLYSYIYGVSTCITRFFNVYGPRHVRAGDNACLLGIFERQKMSGEHLTVTGTGEQKRDFTHVYDICDGLIAAGKGKWRADTFNLGRGRNYSVNEVAAMYKPLGIQYIPARPGEAWETLADLSQTKDKLGWEPRMNLPDYVDDFLYQLVSCSDG